MAAQPEPFVVLSPDLPGELVPAGRTAAILPLRRVHADGRPVINEAAGDRLGPARGLLLGLLLGAAMWLALGALAWLMFG